MAEIGQSRRNSICNPIPPPKITVKSEFPTLSRSKVQQSLTCLITLEVGDKGWQNYSDDVPPVPSLPQGYEQQYQPPSPSGRINSQYSFDRPETSRQKERELEVERERDQAEALAAITEELRQRVENWHGLDFNRYVVFCVLP